MTKFYLSKNAGRPVVIGPAKDTFTFEQCQYFAPTSSWWGVYASEDPEEIKRLEPGVESGLLEEITQAECREWLDKKKVPSSSHNITVLSTKSTSTVIAGPKPATVAAPVAPAPAVESVVDILATAPVKPAKK